MSFDLGGIYETAFRQLSDLAPALTDEQLATPVPTCPGWDVHAVYSHLCGLAVDRAAGATELGSETSTARQVGERRGLAIADVLAEWQPAAEEMVLWLREHREYRALAIDAWTHGQDIHNALGIVSGREGPGLEFTMSAVWRLKRQLRDSGTAPFRIVAGDNDWLIGDDAPAATLTIDPYELARAVLGRRSRNQILAYQWEGDPEPYATMLPVFSPPESDIIE